MATRTIANGGGNWNVLGTWVEGAVPTASDDVVATATSGNVTITATANCRSANFTNYVGTLTHNTGITWNIGTSSTPPANKTLVFVVGMTYTIADATAALNLNSTAGTQSHSVTTAGKILGNVTLGGASGMTHLLADDMTCAAITASRGFNMSGKNLTCVSFSSTGAGTRTLTLSGILTLTGTGAVWTLSGSGYTLSSTAANNIVISDTSASSKTFNGGANIWNQVTVTGGGSGAVIFAGGDTFTFLIVNAPKTVTFTAGTTTTIQKAFVATGSSGNVITLQSSTGASAWTISKASGIVNNLDWVSIQDSTATGGAAWYAGVNSTSVSGNTGWTFSAPLIPGSGRNLLLGIGI